MRRPNPPYDGAMTAPTTSIVLASPPLQGSSAGHRHEYRDAQHRSAVRAGSRASSGRPTQRDADSLYRHILAVEPKHISSLYNAGLIGVQIGRPDVAADMISKAVALNNDVPEWQYNLGLALHALGRVNDAVAHYRQADRTQSRTMPRPT